MISVTRALSVIDQDYGPQGRVEAAALRGTRVHSACTSYAMGLFPCLDDEIEGYYASFKAWFDDNVDKVMMEPEIWLEDKVLGFGGHPDLPWVRLKNGKAVLIDLKTPVQYRRSWDLQMGAYWHLVRREADLTILDPAVLMLDQDGGLAKLEWVEEPEQKFSLFLQALNLWKFFNGGGKGK